MSVEFIPVEYSEISNFPWAFTIRLANEDGITPVGALVFQHDYSPEQYENGITMEALAGFLIERLEGYQADPVTNCSENAEMLTHLRRFVETTQRRAAARKAAGVYGQYAAIPIATEEEEVSDVQPA